MQRISGTNLSNVNTGMFPKTDNCWGKGVILCSSKYIVYFMQLKEVPKFILRKVIGIASDTS
jgi:hypothetical protein